MKQSLIVIPDFFFEIIKSKDYNDVIDLIGKQSINYLNKICLLDIFIQKFENQESYKSFFVKVFIGWLKNHYNIYIWNDYNENVKKIYEKLTKKYHELLKEELRKLTFNLKITDFDKQIRYSNYLLDTLKYQTIESILKY